MKIIIVGAYGTLGQAVAAELGRDNEIVKVGRSRGDHKADLKDDGSVRRMLEAIGPVDAIISTTGSVHFGPLSGMSAAQFNEGLQDKLLGQVRLALLGQHYLNDGGSITLTTGIIAQHPIKDGVNAMAVNTALEGFVHAASTEMPGRRINAVSPTVLTESLPSYGPYFPGFESVPAGRAALAFRRSVQGVESGRVYRVW